MEEKEEQVAAQAVTAPPQEVPPQAPPVVPGADSAPMQGYGQYPYGSYPYAQPAVTYVRREPSALQGVVLAVLSLVILAFCYTLSAGVLTISGWRRTMLLVYYILITLAQLTLAIFGLVVSRGAMKSRPCKRASVGFTMSLVDLAVGAMVLLQFLVNLIVVLK